MTGNHVHVLVVETGAGLTVARMERKKWDKLSPTYDYARLPVMYGTVHIKFPRWLDRSDVKMAAIAEVAPGERMTS